MSKHTIKECPKCGQQLRFPTDVGGVLMACPSCGKKFHSDFKVGGTKRRSAGTSVGKGMLITIFELPSKVVSRIGRFLFPK